MAGERLVPWFVDMPGSANLHDAAAVHFALTPLADRPIITRIQEIGVRSIHRMKAQHRKELHTNLLADRLGRILQVLQNPKEGPSTSVLVAIGLVLVAIGCVLGWMWYVRHSQQVTSAENRDLDQAQSREDYKKLADAHPNTPAGRVARRVAASRRCVRALPASLRSTSFRSCRRRST